MKDLNIYLSKKSLSLGNGPALDRKRTGNESRRLLSILAILIVLFSIGVGNAWGDEHVTLYWSSDDDTSTQKNFTATSGSVTGVLSFSSSGNSGSTPAYNSSNEQLRLYYASNGKGGSVTITAADGVTFTSFEIGSATQPTTKYTVSGGSATAISFTQTTDDYFGNLYYGGADVSTTSIKIQNCNATNTQLQIYYIYLEYTVASCSADPSTANASINGSF